MKSRYEYLPLGLLMVAVSVGAQAGGGGRVCTPVSGQMLETILPQPAAPFDPFGRILGQFTGEIGGVTNASMTAILLDPPGFNTTIRNTHAFLTGPGDVIRTEGITRFIPGPGSQCPLTPCTVENPQTLTIVGGTGKYAGASGELHNLGQGQLDLLHGAGTFIFVVKGELCLPKNPPPPPSMNQPGDGDDDDDDAR